MLGLLLLYFIGKYYFKLAENFNKNKWLYAILGVVSYYVGAAIGGVVLGIADAVLELNIDWDNNILLSLIALPFGIGFCYLLYYLLKRNWGKSVVIPKNEIEDIGKITD